LGNSPVADRLAASEGRLSSMEFVSLDNYVMSLYQDYYLFNYAANIGIRQKWI
jgi:hypothetical protein